MPINGTCIKSDFMFLQNDPNVVVTTGVIPKTSECCFELNVLAELVKDSDPEVADLRNDKHSFVEYFSVLGFTAAKMYLQKFDGSWPETGILLSDDTYGKNYPYDFYRTIYDEKSIGYCMDFHKILTILGEGDYRLMASGTNIFGNEIKSYSLALCLKKWTIYRADKTTRFTWYRNGNNGEPRDFTKRRDYGSLNWFNQLRVPGMFWGKSSAFTRTNVKYQNGNVIWLEDDLINEYGFNSERMPDYVHDILRYDMLQADNILVTDYSLINPTKIKNLRIYPNGGYEPVYDAQVLNSPVELKFLDQVQQFSHKRS